jgi:antitoxin component YwqK of YwqJK toxin-antitoxin module
MNKYLSVFILMLLMHNVGIAQKINGQWRGYFNSKGDIVLSGGENTEYVLEIEIKDTNITGYSYTYFQDRKYYVICSLAGTYYKSTKSMVVNETAKIKGFTPLGWSDCLQTHILTYEKDGAIEEMKGSWRTAPGQLGECGTGMTTLTRRTLSKDLASFNKPKTNMPFSGPKPATKSANLASTNKKATNTAKKATGTAPMAKTKPPAKKSAPISQPVAKNKPSIKTTPAEKNMPDKITEDVKKQAEIIPAITGLNFETRSKEIIKTIEISGENFSVALYDNGAVDGDSISLFYNGKVILSHKMLSEKPIRLDLDATTNNAVNELTMYAENLGTIPPNTALMVVTDGGNRYEVRISSDLKKSGTIRFVHKPTTD